MRKILKGATITFTIIFWICALISSCFSISFWSDRYGVPGATISILLFPVTAVVTPLVIIFTSGFWLPLVLLYPPGFMLQALRYFKAKVDGEI